MDGIEIVITPRTIERVIFSIVILVLGILLIVNLAKDCTVADTASIEAETDTLAAPLEGDASAAASDLTGVNSCENGIKDTSETDVDCGGECGACAEYKACNMDKDCEEGLYCFQRIKCLAPTCDDGVKNQDETDVDCGGVCGGYFWESDSTCHDDEEPSGRLDVTVDANIGESPNSGFAVINEVTLNFDNGLGKDISVETKIFLRSSSGAPLKENKEGEYPIQTQTYTIKEGEKVTKVVDLSDNTYKTLTNYEPDDRFQVVVELRDAAKKTLIDEVSWLNE